MFLDSPFGAVAVAVEAFPTFHDMNAVRGCIQLSEASEIKTSMSQDVFWDGLVADAKDALAPGIVSDHGAQSSSKMFTKIVAAYTVRLPGKSACAKRSDGHARYRGAPVRFAVVLHRRSQ